MFQRSIIRSEERRKRRVQERRRRKMGKGVREGKERGSERENWWLLISWVQSLRSFYLLWFLCTGSPVFFWKVSPFLETSWSWVPPTCGSDLVLDPPWLWCTCQTPKEAPICFSTIKSETFYSLLRIEFAEHQTQFTSIVGQECPRVSECVLGAAWLIPEPIQAFTLLEPGQFCHFFDQKLRSTVSGRRHPRSRSLES